jgi:hypothetical protein
MFHLKVASEMLGFTSCCCMNCFTTGTTGWLVNKILVKSVMMWSWLNRLFILEVLRKSTKTVCEDTCSTDITTVQSALLTELAFFTCLYRTPMFHLKTR